MNRQPIKFQVLQDVFDGKSMLDETNFYNQNYGEPDMLTTKLTWLYGDNRSMFPIVSMTEGNVFDYEKDASGTVRAYKKEKNYAIKEINDVQYDYPVIGRVDKPSAVGVTDYSAGDRPGLGNSTFVVRFTDNWLKRHYIIESPLNIQARIMKDPEFKGGYWEYTLQLDPATPDTFCPVSELRAGTLWISLNTAVSESESTGTDFKRVAPGKLKNQISFIRQSHQWSGNVANKVMKFNIEAEGKSMSLWMDWEAHLFEREWLMQKENLCWYSRYNRLVDGTVSLQDLFTSKVIPRGAGILEQIPNHFTYSKLTYAKLQSTVRDALFGQMDTEGMSVTLYTGTGGIQEFHRALAEAGFTNQISGNAVIENKFITGEGYNLALGGYFTTLHHIDGYTIKVVKNEFFDKGPRAKKSPKHPETGLPLESYRMVFIDDAQFDGEPNMIALCQKNRKFIHGVLKGLTPIPRTYELIGGSSNNNFISTDQDKAGYHRMASHGIQIRRAQRCMHLECVAGTEF